MPPFHHPFLLPPLSLFCFHVEGNRRGNAACFRQLDPSINHVVESMASVRGSRVLFPSLNPASTYRRVFGLFISVPRARLLKPPSLQLFAFDFSTREGFNNLPRSNKFSFHWLGWDRTGWFHRISRSRGGRNKGRDVFFFLNVKLVSKDDEITKSLHRSHRVNTAISSMNE